MRTAALVLSVLFLLSCTENEFVPPPTPTVTVTTPVQQDVTIFLDGPGRLRAVDEVRIPARVEGYLAGVHYEEGTLIKKGDLLFTIEEDQYKAAQAKAVADVAGEDAKLELAKIDYQKIKAVFERGAATDVEVRTAKAKQDLAAAQVQAAKAKVAQADLDVSYTKVTSPIDGIAGDSLFDVGDQVGGLTTAVLTTVVRREPIYADFNPPERGVIRVTREVGGRLTPDLMPAVRLQLADGSDYKHEGKVDFIDNTVDPDTGTLRMRAVFPNPEGTLLPGLYARILFPIEAENAILVPESALQRDLTGYYLMTVNAESKVERLNVKVGRRSGEHRVITEGLEATQKIIVKGLQRARLGAKVNVEEVEPTKPAAVTKPPSPTPDASPPDTTKANPDAADAPPADATGNTPTNATGKQPGDDANDAGGTGDTPDAPARADDATPNEDAN